MGDWNAFFLGSGPNTSRALPFRAGPSACFGIKQRPSARPIMAGLFGHLDARCGLFSGSSSGENLPMTAERPAIFFLRRLRGRGLVGTVGPIYRRMDQAASDAGPPRPSLLSALLGV